MACSLGCTAPFLVQTLTKNRERAETGAVATLWKVQGPHICTVNVAKNRLKQFEATLTPPRKIQTEKQPLERRIERYRIS